MNREQKLSALLTRLLAMREEGTPGEWILDEYKGGRRIVVNAGGPVSIDIFRNKFNSLLICGAVNAIYELKGILKEEGNSFSVRPSDVERWKLAEEIEAMPKYQRMQIIVNFLALPAVGRDLDGKR